MPSDIGSKNGGKGRCKTVTSGIGGWNVECEVTTWKRRRSAKRRGTRMVNMTRIGVEGGPRKGGRKQEGRR